MAMKGLTASEVAEKWQRRASNAVSDWKTGIENVSEAPTEKAAAAKNKMRNNLLNAIDSGKWESGLKRVSLDDWKDATTSKGQTRYSEGVSNAQGKMEAFMDEWLPYQEKIQKKLASMPNETLEDSINRMTTQVREAAKFTRSG